MPGGLRIDVKLPIVKEMDAAQPSFHRGFEYVPRVFHPIHVADFVAVESRDRQFRDAQFSENKLDDDLGVEMEIVGVLLEWNLSQGRGGIEAITGVELRELQIGRAHV